MSVWLIKCVLCVCVCVFFCVCVCVSLCARASVWNASQEVKRALSILQNGFLPSHHSNFDMYVGKAFFGYTTTSFLTQRQQILAWHSTCRNLCCQFLECRGTQYIFVTVPNKTTNYVGFQSWSVVRTCQFFMKNMNVMMGFVLKGVAESCFSVQPK